MSEIEIDLWGNEINPQIKQNYNKMGYCQKFKYDNNYRPCESKDKKCGTCKYIVRGKYHSKSYNKCRLLGDSRSMSTDIRVKYICNLHEAIDKTTD